MLENSLLTLEQFKEFADLLRDAKRKSPELEQAFNKADPKKVSELIGENLSWCHYYEMPFHNHVISGILILGWHEGILNSFTSKDIPNALLNFLNSVSDQDEWRVGSDSPYKESDLVAVVVSLMKSMQSLMVYQKSLSSLVEEVRHGNDSALFDAVRIDRTILGCEPIKHRLSLAELKNDKRFFLRLKAALKGRSYRHMAALDEMRYMMLLLVGMGMTDLSGEDLERLFVAESGLYSNAFGADAAKSLNKHFVATKKRKHFK